MTSKKASPRVRIDFNTFLLIKRELRHSSIKELAEKYGFGETTIRRVKRSVSLREYRAMVAASNGNSQFNENELERELNAVRETPSHDSLHHYQNQPSALDNTNETRKVAVVGIIVVLSIAALVVFFIVR